MAKIEAYQKQLEASDKAIIASKEAILAQIQDQEKLEASIA